MNENRNAQGLLAYNGLGSVRDTKLIIGSVRAGIMQ